MARLGSCWESEDIGKGVIRHTQHLKPIAFEHNGVMRRIGNALAASGDADFPVGADELCQFRVHQRIAGKSPLIHFGKGQSMARIALVGANNVAGVVKDNTVTFLNAWNNADLRYTLAGHRLQEDILLKAGHPRTFGFLLDSHVGFNSETLEWGSDFRVLQPVLEPPVGSDKMAIPLAWLVTKQGGKWQMSVTLPSGDWTGWTLDPTLTLQPDAAAGIDTYVRSQDAPDANFGTATFLHHASNVGGVYISSLVKFDLSALAGATITAATLTYYSTGVDSGYPHTVNLHQILAANSGWTEAGATWNYAVASVTRWAGDAANNGGSDAGCSVSGTDYSATVDGSFTVTGDAAVGAAFPVSITPARMAVIVAANYGWTSRIVGSATYHQFASSDHATAAYRPKLVIDYTLPGGLLLRANKTGNKGVWMLGGKQC